MTVGSMINGAFELLFCSLRPQGSLSAMAASVTGGLSLSLAVNKHGAL